MVQGYDVFQAPLAGVDDAFLALGGFCRDSEGWGPFSPSHDDLSPCFIDALDVAVSAWGLLAATLTAVVFYRTNWRSWKSERHFYLRIIVPGGLLAVVLARVPLTWSLTTGIPFTGPLSCVCLLAIAISRLVDNRSSRLCKALVLVYWIGALAISTIRLHSIVVRGTRTDYAFALWAASAILIGVQLTLESLTHTPSVPQGQTCPIENASLLSYLTFSWVSPMLRLGHRKRLVIPDLWNLHERDKAQDCFRDFITPWNTQVSAARQPSLWLALARGFGGLYFRGALFKLAADCLSILQPHLFRQFILFAERYQSTHETRSQRHSQPHSPSPAVGAGIAAAMFAVSVMGTICLHQYYQRTFETGMRVKAGLTAAIYQKSLRLSNDGVSENRGTIVNHMAVDAQLLQNLCQHGHQIWSAPTQIVLCLISLYNLVGLSVFAGIVVMLLTLLTGAVIAKITEAFQRRKMENSDARIILVTEILNNIKAIKMYAWTSAFKKKLSGVRGIELLTLRKIGALRAAFVFTWSATPSLVSTSIFAAFVLTQRSPLSTDIGFPALTLFNLLTLALAVFPQTINSWIDANVAVQRLLKFLTAPELQSDAIKRLPEVEEDGESVSIHNAALRWQRDGNDVLQSIDYAARQGELSCIVGRVGAGKSSLLSAMLGEMHKTKGEVVVRGTVAFVAQTPWIIDCSIRENIIFGNR